MKKFLILAVLLSVSSMYSAEAYIYQQEGKDAAEKVLRIMERLEKGRHINKLLREIFSSMFFNDPSMKFIRYMIDVNDAFIQQEQYRLNRMIMQKVNADHNLVTIQTESTGRMDAAEALRDLSQVSIDNQQEAAELLLNLRDQ